MSLANTPRVSSLSDSRIDKENREFAESTARYPWWHYNLQPGKQICIATRNATVCLFAFILILFQDPPILLASFIVCAPVIFFCQRWLNSQIVSTGIREFKCLSCRKYVVIDHLLRNGETTTCRNCGQDTVVPKRTSKAKEFTFQVYNSIPSK